MRRKLLISILALLIVSVIIVGYNRNNNIQFSTYSKNTNGEQEIIFDDSKVINLEKGLSTVQYNGDYGFDDFIAQGGANSDSGVVSFLTNRILSNISDFSFRGIPFGCSTISAKNAEGELLFGRNFDWNRCNAMIVSSKPENGYSSISTVNTDFIKVSGVNLSKLPDEIQSIICLYAPLDGMNEKGLVVSVNMIQDSATINQNTDKKDITTTTAIRLLLDKSANVEEAINLLNQYDMHASMGYMMHLALADTTGRSVVVEYVNNEMVVIETPVVTNFYLAEGDKNGIGTAQSHTRYEILTKTLSQTNTMSMTDIRDALDSVSKDNFGEFESTEWSIVFNQSTGEVHYYHRENYGNKYIFKVMGV